MLHSKQEPFVVFFPFSFLSMGVRCCQGNRAAAELRDDVIKTRQTPSDLPTMAEGGREDAVLPPVVSSPSSTEESSVAALAVVEGKEKEAELKEEVQAIEVGRKRFFPAGTSLPAGPLGSFSVGTELDGFCFVLFLLGMPLKCPYLGWAVCVL